jgi:hypothetical protein
MESFASKGASFPAGGLSSCWFEEDRSGERKTSSCETISAQTQGYPSHGVLKRLPDMLLMLGNASFGDGGRKRPMIDSDDIIGSLGIVLLRFSLSS